MQGMGWDQGPSGGGKGRWLEEVAPKVFFTLACDASEAGTEFLAASSHPSGPCLAGVRGASLAVGWNGRTQKKVPLPLLSLAHGLTSIWFLLISSPLDPNICHVKCYLKALEKLSLLEKISSRSSVL